MRIWENFRFEDFPGCFCRPLKTLWQATICPPCLRSMISFCNETRRCQSTHLFSGWSGTSFWGEKQQGCILAPILFGFFPAHIYHVFYYDGKNGILIECFLHLFRWQIIQSCKIMWGSLDVTTAKSLQLAAGRSQMADNNLRRYAESHCLCIP